MDKYNSMQQQIATNMTDLQNLQASYSTLVSNLKNIVKVGSNEILEIREIPTFLKKGLDYSNNENNIK